VDPRLPDGLSPWQVVVCLCRHPGALVLSRWNYKAAVTSAVSRAGLFFTMNLSAGWSSALLALVVEFAYRFAMSGFYGALTQAFRRAHPPGAATAAAMVVVPGISHTLELLLHLGAGTPELGRSIVASVTMSMLTTSLNVWLMRRGVMVVGPGARPLLDDLRRIPQLLWNGRAV